MQVWRSSNPTFAYVTYWDVCVSSSRPELVVLTECLDDHEDDINLLYLTDSEAILQAIQRWIDCGAKLNLSKSPDADVFKTIILKLQMRVQVGAATLLVKVKAHRGGSLNEEADIRAEMGRRNEPTQSGIDSTKKQEKLRRFEH
jgi:ribonuclease HI